MNVQPELLDVVTDVSTLLDPSGVSVHQDTNYLAIERLVLVRTNIFSRKMHGYTWVDFLTRKKGYIVDLCES